MEFNFDIAKAIGNCDKNGICILNGLHSDKFHKNNAYVSKLLDEIGYLSAKAQELKSVITTGLKFFGTDQRIYLKCEGSKFIGFIKVGKKKLFIYDEIGSINELNPLCVLDFYVYEGCQRTGFGKELFSKMIDCEKIEPRKMGYDRPSSKLISFLKKHYGLIDYVPQNNNYVVFNDYFLQAKSSVSERGYALGNQEEKYSQGKLGASQQPKTFHQLKVGGYDVNKAPSAVKGIESSDKGNYSENYSMNCDDNQDLISKMTIPYNYQYTSSSSEYGAFHNINPKQNYHYSFK